MIIWISSGCLFRCARACAAACCKALGLAAGCREGRSQSHSLHLVVSAMVPRRRLSVRYHLVPELYNHFDFVSVLQATYLPSTDRTLKWPSWRMGRRTCTVLTTTTREETGGRPACSTQRVGWRRVVAGGGEVRRYSVLVPVLVCRLDGAFDRGISLLYGCV